MKKIILFSLFLILGILSNATTIMVQNTNDNGIGSLRQAVINAKNNDTIRFNSSLISGGSNIIYLDSQLVFSKNLVFKGLYNSTDTLYINGQDSSRIFKIEMHNMDLKLVLDSIFLQNTKTLDSGGGIYVFSNSIVNLQIYNSKIEQCNAIGSGGGIYIYTSSLSISSILIIENSTISFNNSINNGGGIFAEIPIKISNSIVSYNTSKRDGGGLFSYSSISISDCEILYNSGDFYGGGVSCINPKSFLKISNSNISNNTVYAFGAGIYCYNSGVDIINSTISNNTSKLDGGGIFSHADDTTSLLTINNCTISFNTAKEGYGGGICGNYQKLNVFNTTIDNNIANIDGGGICAYGLYSQINIKNSTIKKNTTKKGNGGGINSNASDTFSIINIENSTFTTNKAYKNGSGIYSNAISSLVNIKNSTIVVHSGDGIYSEGLDTSIVNIKNSTIMYNSKGIISYAKSSNVSFEGSILALNYSGNLIQAGNFKKSVSKGYNIFGDVKMNGSQNTDSLGAKSTQINIPSLLANNGGTTETLMPLCGSIAIDAGNPSDTSSAQNANTFNGRRDIGAAEYLNYRDINTTVCEFMTSPSEKYKWTKSGNYMDTIIDQNGCRSIITVYLTVNNHSFSSQNISTCEKYESPSGKYLWNQSGTYLDTLINMDGCDSILTIKLIIDTLDISLSMNTNKNSIISNQPGAIYQWINCDENSIIIGAKNQSYTPTKNGNYAVIVKNNSCEDTSVCVSVTNAGINQKFLEEINVFPNPSTGIFLLDFNDSKSIYNIVITDVLGKTLKDFTTNKTQEKIDLSNYGNCVYFIKISNENGNKTIKIIKK